MDERKPAAVERHIELRQLVGLTEDGREVRHGTDEIILNQIRIGYVGHRPSDPINFIRPGVLTDPETLAAIRAAVAARHGGQQRRVYGVPELTSNDQLDREEGVTTQHSDE